MSLIMVNEGHRFVHDFFVKNGVKPSQAVFDLECFEEVEPFISKEDRILIVIHGFTDFHTVGILQLMDKLSDNNNVEYENVIILSDMIINNMKHEYYLYEGNPFKSKIRVVRGKSIIDESELLSKEKDIVKKQGVIESLRMYGNSTGCLTLEDTKKRSKGVLTKNDEDDALYSKIKMVKVFKEDK